MVSIDASKLSIRELNTKIKTIASEGLPIQIMNPEARHNIAVGILDQCDIKIEGSVGYYTATLLDGPNVTIDGNAGWALGENLMSGKISVAHDAGALSLIHI